MRTLYSLITLLICCFHFSFGQVRPQLKFDRITTERIIIEKGLSQNSGLTIIQDSRGFMWFGTWDGLNRFDGYEFMIYNNENGLSHNTIRSLYEDDMQNLWIGTEDGLDKLNLLTGNFEAFQNVAGQYNTLSSDFITQIIPGTGSDIWICTDNGLNNYDYKKDIFKRISFYDNDVDTSLSNYINCAHLDDQKLWIGTNHGLHCLDLKTRAFTAFHADADDKQTLSDNRVISILKDSKGCLWVGTRNGLNRSEPGEDSFRQYFSGNAPVNLSNNTINALFEDSEGNVWIGTADKLNMYDYETGTFIRYYAQPENTSLSNNDIRSIYEDATGTVWIGTYKGINKIDKHSSRFTHYKHEPGNPASLSNNIIYSIIEGSDNKVWIATYGGLNMMDRNTGIFKSFHHVPGVENSLVSEKLRVIVEDPAGLLWIGTENSGVQTFNPANGLYSTYQSNPADSSTLTGNSIVSMKIDHRGRIWIGTRSGLNILDPATNIINRSLNETDNPDMVPDPTIWTMFFDNQNRMWVGTDGGLIVYDQDLKRVASYYHDDADPNSLSGNRIMTINQDSDGNFWVGTIGAGLNLIDIQSGEITRYTEDDGLPNNVVYSALEDDEGQIWIITNWGLTRFNRKNGSFILYDVIDGIQGNEFNGGAYFKNSQGEMYFGGMNGFNLFHPDEIKMNESPPVMVITGFRIFDDPSPGPFLDGDTIVLKHNDNFFSIEFAALEYTNPSKNLFRYKMNNYDDTWTTTNASLRSADYKKVSPGTYRFQVKGSNNDGVWNEDGVSIVIIITPPWWETWIFRISFALMVILSFWSIIFWRFKTLKKKHEVERKVLEIEKQLFELEQKALRLQMNPHFIFNSLNAIQSFVIANNTDKAIHYLAKFSHLMRMILANSSESYIPLKDELKALKYYMDLEQLRFDDSFEYFIHIDKLIDDDFIEIPPMMLQPYVENSVIHGLNHKEEKGRLDIRFELKDNLIICEIEDNGIGRKKAREIREKSGIRRQSRGMMITKERLEIMKRQNKEDFFVEVQDLKDDHGLAAGTKVILAIHYREI